jgi:hypothetical protein
VTRRTFGCRWPRSGLLFLVVAVVLLFVGVPQATASALAAPTSTPSLTTVYDTASQHFEGSGAVGDRQVAVMSALTLDRAWISRSSAQAGFVAAETAVGEAKVAFGPAPENAWSTFDRVSSKGSPLPGYKGARCTTTRRGYCRAATV